MVSGRMGWQVGDGEKHTASPGETLVFKAGEPHRFWAEGDEALECTGWIRPPQNVEYFLTEMYRSIRTNGGRPDDFDAAYLMHRYRSEFDMLEIPGFVKAVVFPVLRVVGRLSGKFKRFDDAPPPV